MTLPREEEENDEINLAKRRSALLLDIVAGARRNRNPSAMRTRSPSPFYVLIGIRIADGQILFGLVVKLSPYNLNKSDILYFYELLSRRNLRPKEKTHIEW